MKIEVTYDADNGIVVPDGKVRDWTHNLVNIYENNTEDYSVVIGAEIMITAIRVAVFQERISYKDITFVFDGKELVIDKHARFSEWPVGFAELNCEMLQELLGW
jgi:hypothetical protein